MRVRFRPRAEEDLNRLYDYIAAEAGADTAFEFIWRCGAPRDDILKGLRILALERRPVIAYRVEDDVIVLAVFHGGQNWTEEFLENDGNA